MYTLSSLRSLHLLALIEKGEWVEMANISRQWENAWAETHLATVEKSRDLAEATRYIRKKGALL